MTVRTEVSTDELVGLFPSETRLDGDGTLMIGGCRLDDVAEQFGTPAIVVSEEALRQRARDYLAAFRSRWQRCDVAFASKSFPCTAVQRVMVEEGLHLDVAGGGEILTAIKAGADPANLVLHGNAKSDEELELAVERGVGLVVGDVALAGDGERLAVTLPGAAVDAVLRGRRPRRPSASRSASSCTSRARRSARPDRS